MLAGGQGVSLNWSDCARSWSSAPGSERRCRDGSDVMGDTCEQRPAAVHVGPAVPRCCIAGFHHRCVELLVQSALTGLGSERALSPAGRWKDCGQPASENGRLRKCNGVLESLSYPSASWDSEGLTWDGRGAVMGM